MKHPRQKFFTMVAAMGLGLVLAPLACGVTNTYVYLPDEDAGVDACADGGHDAGADCGEGGANQGGSSP